MFKTLKELKSFLHRKINPVTENKIEYYVMERFLKNKILFTAEHASTDEIVVKNKIGKEEIIFIGDKNTDLLAKLAANYLRSAYIFPLFERTRADASRPPEDLGKGLRLFVKVFPKTGKGESKTSCLLIHKDKTYLPYLMEYHRLIDQLNPKALVSIHGMSSKRKFDVLFGFGDDYLSIGGEKEAFRFKDEFIYFIDKVFSQMGIRNNLEIAVSTWLFKGSKNYVLTKHIIDYNKKNKDKRIGMQVEFNWSGRVKDYQKDPVPTLTYQILVQALGDFIFKWLYEKKNC